MTVVQRGAWSLLVAVFAVAILMLVGRDLYLDADDIVVPAVLAMAVIGSWISLRRPSSPIGWLFLTAGCLMALLMLAGQVVDETLAAGGAWVGWQLVAALWINVGWYPVMALCMVYVPLLFPDGAASPGWRTITLTMAAVQGLLLLGACVGQQLEPTDGVLIPNPLALGAPSVEQQVGELLGTLMVLLLPLGLGLGAISLVQRHRRAGEVERQQLRWFVAAVLLLLVTALLSIAVEAWLPAQGVARVVGSVLLALGLIALPSACGVAILRYRLYEIDRIISRTLAYALVTAAVLGTYALVVTTLTRLVPVSSNLAVAGATLAAAAMVRPILRRVQGVVDRRFNRTRFDTYAEVERFAARLRDSVDPDLATAELAGTVQRTLAPAELGIWIR